MRRNLCWICSLAGAVAALWILAVMLAAAPSAYAAGKPVRVLAWSERTEPADVYPQGINGAIVEMFKGDKSVQVKMGNLSDPDQGLNPEMLANADVLIWFGHRKHADVTDANVDLVLKQVRERGMGFIPLHSAHYSKPFQKALVEIAGQKGIKLADTPGKWGKVKNEGRPELIHVLEPKHPIAKGVKDFTIPKTEVYWNPFTAPPADVKILEGRYEGDMQDGNDGLLWNFGRGKVFYFRPGHETYPIYFQPEVQKVLRNAVHFLGRRQS